MRPPGYRTASRMEWDLPLRKHAYWNIMKFLRPKNENFQIKNSDIFHISAQHKNCGYLLESPRWGDSNEYPQFMFLNRTKKNNVYLCKPQFYCIKVGFKGVKNYIGMFSWCRILSSVLETDPYWPRLHVSFMFFLVFILFSYCSTVYS